MLKGILFIIAIIVTFDIGKSLIDSYREEQAVEKDQKQASDASEDIGGNSSSIEFNKKPMNLDLPDEIPEEEQGEIFELEDESNFSVPTEKEKPLELNAKPIMTFDVETRTPDVTGVTVEVKKTY